MSENQISSAEHNYAFDFIRMIALLGVILYHAASAYSVMGAGFWPVQDSTNFPGSTINNLTDVFIMPFFLFIAGYFALPSIKNKSLAGFFMNKFRRLFLYWIIIMVIFLPIIWYFMFKLNVMNFSFLTHWLNSVTNIQDISNTNDKMLITRNLPMHFWFISFLFYVFIVFGIVYKLFCKFFANKTDSDNKTDKNISILHILASGILISLIYFIFILIYPSMNWIIVSKFLQVQTNSMPILILFFCFGVYSNYKGWFVKNNLPYNIKIWTIISLIFTALFLTVGNEFLNNIMISNNLPVWYLLIFSFIRSFLLMSYLMLTITIAVKYFKIKNILVNKFSNVSYEAYIVHVFPLIFLQGFFTSFTMIPIIIKILVIFILTSIISYFLGKYTIHKFPKIVGAIFAVIFILMLVLYR